MRKKILVTGGAGYIGSKLSYELLDKKKEVIIIDNLSTGSIKLIPKKQYSLRWFKWHRVIE